MTESTGGGGNRGPSPFVNQDMITSTHRNRTGRRVVLGALTALTVTTVLATASGVRSEAEPRGAETTGTSVPQEAAPASDQTYLGRLVAAYVAPDELVLDEQLLLEGDNGDGAYELRDLVAPNRTFPVAAGVAVTRVDCEDGGCRQDVPGDYGRLTLDVAEQPPANVFRIVVRDGQVVQIDEVYLA